MKFEDFIDVRDGTHDSPKAVKDGMYLLTTKGLKNQKIDFEGLKKVSFQDAKKINERSIVEQYDILLSMIGTVGNVYQERKSSVPYVIKNVALLKFHGDKVLSDWIYYYLLSPSGQQQINLRKKGSTQQFISLKDIRNISVDLPSRSEMKLLVKKLNVVNDKILLNEQINDNLDELLSTIFFKQVINSVFSEQKLTDIANFKNGLAMQKYKPKSDKQSLPVLKIKELSQGHTDDTSDKCSTKIDPEVIVHTGDIIFSWSGTLMVKNWAGRTAGLNQHLFKVTSANYPDWFIYEWTKYHLKTFRSIAAGKATTMGHIKRSDLKAAKVFVPNSGTLNQLDKIMMPLYNKRIEIIKENQKLRDLKQILLRKYF